MNKNNLPKPPSIATDIENGNGNIYPPPPPVQSNTISVIDVNNLTAIKFLKELLLHRINEFKSLPINAVLSSSSNIEYILDQAKDIISNINNEPIEYTPTTSTVANLSESSSILEHASELISQLSKPIEYTPTTSTVANLSESSSILEHANELISQLSTPIEYTPSSSAVANLSESSSILEHASELISQLSRPIEYTPPSSTVATVSESSDVVSIIDHAGELISQLSRPIEYTPPSSSTVANLSESSNVASSILDHASKLIPEISIPIEYTPTTPIIATISDYNAGSIVDNASNLIEAIKYYPPKTKWYEPSDKYKDKSTLNVNGTIKLLNKKLVIKEVNGNTIIEDIYKK